jgi:hypothetical protein
LLFGDRGAYSKIRFGKRGSLNARFAPRATELRVAAQRDKKAFSIGLSLDSRA